MKNKIHSPISSVNPYVNGNVYIKCLKCKDICPVEAIIEKDKSVILDSEKCSGCGQCIMVCSEKAIKIKWDSASTATQEKMAEFASAIIKNRKSIFINFILKVSPEYDCYSHSETGIVPDIGIIVSTDQVAIDKASADMINSQKGIKESALKSAFKPGEDKIKDI